MFSQNFFWNNQQIYTHTIHFIVLYLFSNTICILVYQYQYVWDFKSAHKERKYDKAGTIIGSCHCLQVIRWIWIVRSWRGQRKLSCQTLQSIPGNNTQYRLSKAEVWFCSVRRSITPIHLGLTVLTIRK